MLYILYAHKKLIIFTLALGMMALLFYPHFAHAQSNDGITLPSLQMHSDVCYYLDEFLPTANSLVTGKRRGLHTRYYTYNNANYKNWKNEKILLVFVSRDNRCWTLVQESREGSFLSKSNFDLWSFGLGGLTVIGAIYFYNYFFK